MSQDYGTPITPPPPVQDYQVPPPLPTPQKSNRTIWIIVAVVVVLLCCCCLVGIGIYLYQNGDQFLNQINGTLISPLSMLV